MSSQTLKNNSLPVQIEGFPYIIGGFLLAVAGATGWRGVQTNPELMEVSPIPFAVLTILFSVFTLFSLWFYRNPKRVTPQDEPQTVFSPADGTVLYVKETSGETIGQEKAKVVAVFMSGFDVHVNRAPFKGTVEKIQYHVGKFFKADLDKASNENEYNLLVMKNDAGKRVAFKQIAGLVARRIVCYVSQGDRLLPGERYGMIRFGSRMEVFVPVDSEALVKEGDKIAAGTTRLFKMRG